MHNTVIAQYKNISVDSLQAKTIVMCVSIFWEPSKTFGVKWHHNTLDSDIGSRIELYQMIAIVLIFYEFCLHLTEMS